MKEYLFLILADLLLAANFAINKVYQKKEGTAIAAGLKFSVYSGLFTMIIFWIMNGFKISFTPYSAVMAAAMTVLATAYTLIGFKLLKSGGMALYTLFLMTGGMVVPYIWGIFFLSEPVSWLRTAGLVLLIFGVVMSNSAKSGVKAKQILMCISVFVLNGFVSVVSKHHSIETNFATVTATEFTMLTGLFKFILAGICYMLIKKEKPDGKVGFKDGIGAIIVMTAASALIGGVSYIFQLKGAQTLPATVLYPFITGGSIVFSAITGWLLFKEKLTKNIVISICLCFAGTLMFL